jgi:hypothetical protein
VTSAHVDHFDRFAVSLSRAMSATVASPVPEMVCSLPSSRWRTVLFSRSAIRAL